MLIQGENGQLQKRWPKNRSGTTTAQFATNITQTALLIFIFFFRRRNTTGATQLQDSKPTGQFLLHSRLHHGGGRGGVAREGTVFLFLLIFYFLQFLIWLFLFICRRILRLFSSSSSKTSLLSNVKRLFKTTSAFVSRRESFMHCFIYLFFPHVYVE